MKGAKQKVKAGFENEQMMRAAGGHSLNGAKSVTSRVWL